MASRKRIVICYILLQASFWGMLSSICAYQIIIRCHAIGKHISIFRAIVTLSIPVDPAGLHIAVLIKEIPFSA
mgnify:CR=1 FL=1